MSNAIEVTGLVKSYKETGTQNVLKGVTFTVKPSEIVAVVGVSGSGKSTLLHTLGGLDTFDEGTVKIADMEIKNLSEAEMGILRNKHLGFVYQFHHLQPEFTVLENVAMPLLIRREKESVAFEKATEVLVRLGLKDKLESLPSQLSGGERQRVAIARAMATNPTSILADEPTGNLDAETAKSVFNSFVSLARERKTAIVIVTHDQTIAAACDRTLELCDGLIKER